MHTFLLTIHFDIIHSWKGNSYTMSQNNTLGLCIAFCDKHRHTCSSSCKVCTLCLHQPCNISNRAHGISDVINVCKQCHVFQCRWVIGSRSRDISMTSRAIGALAYCRKSSMQNPWATQTANLVDYYFTVSFQQLMGGIKEPKRAFRIRRCAWRRCAAAKI